MDSGPLKLLQEKFFWFADVSPRSSTNTEEEREIIQRTSSSEGFQLSSD